MRDGEELEEVIEHESGDNSDYELHIAALCYYVYPHVHAVLRDDLDQGAISSNKLKPYSASSVYP